MAREKRKMTFLFPNLLWFLIPLVLLYFKNTKNITFKIHIIILILLLLSLSRPVQKKILQKRSIEAKNIIIALDVSYSMQAKDINPTRYAFAKETIKSLLLHNHTDNIMLIAFTTNPLLLSPPSTDHALIGLALESLNPEFILTKGTSLSTLFKKINSLHASHKNLILITDGGEEKNIEELTYLLNKTDTTLLTLALGTAQGSTIQNKNSLLKDKEGNLVVSRINPLLKDLTVAMKGTYLTASSSPQNTAKLIELSLSKQAKKNIKKMQNLYKEYYQIPLLFATLLFLLLHTRGIKYLILFYALFGLQLHASILDSYYLHQAYKSYTKHDFNTAQSYIKRIDVHSLQSKMTLADIYYQNGFYKKAIYTYKSIHSTSISIKQQLYYNIATAYVHLKVYSKARTYYTKALQLGVDADSKYNLKLIAFLADKKVSSGMTHPQSQNVSSTQDNPSNETSNKRKKENQPSSGSGRGKKSNSKNEKNKLLLNSQAQKHPLSSKVYELINKGYIHETQPW